MSLSRLPLELCSHILSHLPLSDVSPVVSEVLGSTVIDDQYERIKRRAPLQFLDRMVHYAKLGYLYGMKREMGEIILDEGATLPILREVGKRGDSTMLAFLLQHGATDIDQALIGGILASQNNFVRMYLDTPIGNIQYLLEAAVISDNLEMAREIYPRTHDYPVYFYTNRTSLWVKLAENQEFLDIGFDAGSPEEDFSHEVVSTAMMSDLIEPLPFTYEFIESLDPDYVKLAIDHAKGLYDGYTRNYARMEWILDAAARQHYFRTPHTRRSRHVLANVTGLDDWIYSLLILVGFPSAHGVLEKAREYFGEAWMVFTDPVQTSEQITAILNRSSTHIEPYEYIPIQYEALEAWLIRAMNNRDNSGNLSPIGESFENGIIFLTKNHPNARSYDRPAHSIIDKKVYPLTISEHDDWIRRFFYSRGRAGHVQVLYKLLEYHLLELWDELSPVYPPTEYSELDRKRILNSAITAGLNSIAESLLPHDMSNIPSVPHNYPRLIMRLGQPTKSRVRHVLQDKLESARYADEALVDMEPLIEERLRFVC